METYFDHITEELKLHVLLKLEYDEYVSVTNNFIEVKGAGKEYLVRLKDPSVWEKVRQVVEHNTRLKFNRYTNRDTYIWDILFVDLMNGLKFSLFVPRGDVIPNPDGIIEYDSKKYNPISIDLLTLYDILLEYPNIYKYVGKYLKFLQGTLLFLSAISTSLRLIHNNFVHKTDATDLILKSKMFIETGDIDKLVVSPNSMNGDSPKTELRLIIMVHILLTSLPKSKVSINPNFVDEMMQFVSLKLLDSDNI